MGHVLHAQRRGAASSMELQESIRDFCSTMARVAMAKAGNELRDLRRQALEKFHDLSRDVNVLSRLQLDSEVLERLTTNPASVSRPDEAPDFVFYTGCNVLKTPHIALLALIIDALGVTYRVMGGPTHCCGVLQLRAGDVEMSGRMQLSTIEKLSPHDPGQVISWCPTATSS